MGIDLCLLSTHIEEGQFQKCKDTDKKKKSTEIATYNYIPIICQYGNPVSSSLQKTGIN